MSPFPPSRFRRALRGAGLVEYGLVVGLVSVLAVGSVLSTGERVESTYCTVVSELRGNLGGDPDASCGRETAETDLLLTVAPTGGSLTYTMRFENADLEIDWGDGTTETFSGTGTVSHTYGTAGSYEIRAAGTATRFQSQSPALLTSVDSFGQLGLTSLQFAFGNHTALTSVPELPGTVTNLREAFFQISGNPSGLSSWDVSGVENFRGVFFSAASFDADLSGWDVSSGEIFLGMFDGASSFNADLSGWNVSSGENFVNMFLDATSFDSDLSQWNVSGASDPSDMFQMFQGASSFDSDLSGWCVDDIGTRPGSFTDQVLTAEPSWGSCP